MRDFYTLTIKKTFRKRKRLIINSLIICFSLLIIFSTFMFLDVFHSYVEESMYKNISFRTFSVSYLDDIPHKEQLENIRSIEHIAFATTTGIEVNVYSKQLASSIRDGKMSIYASKKVTLPKVTIGREFEDSEKKVLICPSDFMPDSDADVKLNFKNRDYIKGKNLLGQEIEFSYRKNEIEYTEKYTVIGIYDSKNNFMGNHVCFANYQDVLRITEILNGDIHEGTTSYSIPQLLVDKIENVDKVIADLEEMGYYPQIGAYLDSEYVKIINIIVITLVCLSSFVFFIVMLLYLKKTIKNNSKEIGLLKAMGYNNITILKNLLVEQLTVLIIAFILSIVIFTIGYIILILLSNFFYLNMKIFRFHYPIMTVLLSFILYFLIAYFVYLLNAKKISKINPIDSMKE